MHKTTELLIRKIVSTSLPMLEFSGSKKQLRAMIMINSLLTGLLFIVVMYEPDKTIKSPQLSKWDVTMFHHVWYKEYKEF